MGLEEQSDRAMMAAVRAGDLNALKELVSNGADPNAKDSYGQPILLGAANNVGILKYLLEDVHLPIEACDKHGYTPLLRASASGNLSVVQYLVSSGANLLARTALGETALHLSARSESVETFQFLQQSGVPMDILDIRGRTVLHHAAQFSCPNMVEYILKGSWWPVDCQDKNGQTPLMLTADFPRNERDRITYIHWFHMSEGYLNKVIRLLVDAGADLSIQDVLGRTVLHQALGYKENFEFLWDKCPEFTHSVDKKGQTPIQIALLNSRYRWDRRYVIRKLLEAGADFKSVGEDGKTALSVAAEQYSYDIVNSLIKAGAETSCCNKDTLTQILYLASGKDDFELTNKVIAEGADVNGRKIDRYPSSTEKGHTVRCLGCYTTGCQVHSELSGHSPLFQTLHSLKMVMLLIGAGADVNFKDNYGCSPLHTALECGHHEVLDVLLDAGGDPNAVDDCGVSLLHTIASRSVAAMVYHTKLRQKIMRFTERLIEAGANINIMDHQGRTPLHYIAVEGNNKGTIQLTEKMIEAGARVDVADHHGRTPLHYVGQSRNLGNYKGMQGIKGIMQLTRMMIEAGARVNVADDHGRTPLHYAAQAGNYKYVKELLKAGADVNAMDMDGATPLLMQSSRNYHEVTQLLVRAGADVTASAKNCQRIIHRASQVGSTTDIDYLFDIWPSNWGSDNQGNTILHFATTCSRNRLQFIEQIVSRKLVFVDERNVHGETPLAMLVKHSSKCNSAQDEVEILLGAGANPTTKDNNGNTPLHMASSVGNVKVMELLIKAGIDFTLKDVINQTSLKWTSSAEGVEDADHVRNQKKAAIIDEKNNEGQTPLLLAAGCRDAVSLLLREGASISVKDHSGKTPLQVAINQGSHSAVRLLWGAGSNFLDIPQECRNKAVHLAVTSGDLEVLEHLISLGLSMSDNWWDPDHKTTLLHCAAKCNVEMLKYLKNQDYMEHGLDYKGRTALHCAVLSSNHIVAKYLLEEVHVPVDERDNDGMTALMLAASNMQYYDKQFDMFEILVNAGADVNIRDRNGKAIYEMVDYTRADMTKELLDYMQYRLSSCMDK
ncbi:serine/threonine-protein phosphatase 6 regulatory ankyrin repeat subunit C-like [Schistocerca gregaria]|uniref:serine/threonine-protein phosphatase 6 regulatory ankyrin repeat subunit C-like n=1 Tax=Schistocerca gregaria TaxID=7010 RepID=UPI00211F3026|nr:serine/threonine-protein phosphatase 6 regulatory ankyrin repeat subunit C-like [Schistocerca gregaria]